MQKTSAQTESHCISIQNNKNQEYNDLGIHRPLKVIDDDGNEYLFNQLAYENSVAGFVASGRTCETDGFIIHFEDVAKDNNYGFDDPLLGLQRRNVVCQLYDDLSKLIVTSTSSSGKPHILIMSDQTLYTKFGMSFPTAPPVNGLASQFYVIPNGLNNEVIEGEVQKTIIGLRNSYTSLPTIFLPLGSTGTGTTLYHGFIAVNFNSIIYNTNITTPCPTGQQDLYTLCLHEALHTLGISSFISESGASIHSPFGHPDLYSRYDKFLRINSTPLITEVSTGNWNYTGAVSSLALNCGGTTNINFNGPALSSDPIFSNPTWIQGTNLSHFGCHASASSMCDPSYYGLGAGSDYVMNPCNAGGADFTKRHPNAQEVKALCDLGYKFKLVTPTTIEYGAIPTNLYTHSTYTNCVTACIPVGVVDNYSTAHATSTTINYTGTTGILWNDFLGRTLGTTVNDLKLINTSSGTFTTTATSFTFTPSPTFAGYAMFSYYPKCPSGTERGLLTYVFILVEPSPSPPCTVSNPCENLVCFGDFEGIPIPSFSNFADFFPNRSPFFGLNSPDLYHLVTPTDIEESILSSTSVAPPSSFFTIPGLFSFDGGCSAPVPTIAPHSGENMIGMGCMMINTSENTYTEGVHMKLAQDLEAGSCGYVFNIWVYGLQSCPTPTARLRIIGGTRNPCLTDITNVATTTGYCDRIVSTCGYEGINLGMIILTNATGWQSYTITLPDNPLLAGISDLLIIGDDVLLPHLSHTTYVYIDDISLRKNCNNIVDVSSFPAEVSTCNDGTININYLLNIPTALSTNLTARLNLPTGFTLTGSTGPYPFGSSLEAIVPAGSSGLVILRATISLGGSSILPGDYTISLSPTTSSSTCFTSTTSTTVHVVPNPLTITKTADRYRAVDGDIVNFTIQVCNTGAIPLSSVQVTDNLPPSFSLVSAPFGTTFIGGVLTFPSFSMSAGSVITPYCHTITFRVEVVYPATGFCDEPIYMINCADAKILSGLSCGSVQGCDADLIVNTAPAGHILLGSNVGYPTISSAVSAGLLFSTASFGVSIIIDGDLDIDNSYEFNSCQIITRPGASISVNSNSLTITDGTHIYSECNTLWKGILLTGNAKLLINNDVLIEDALHAVNDKIGYNTMIISNCSFRNNFIGIYLEDIYNLTPITSVRFTGTRNLYNPYIGMSIDIHTATEPTPTISNRGWAGIHAKGINTITVGGFGQTSYFDGLANGIVLGGVRTNGPTCNVLYCKFSNHRKYGYASTNGTGIYASNFGAGLGLIPPSSLIVQGDNPINPNFSYCTVNAINTNFYNTNIQNNYILGSRIGVNSTDYVNATIIIHSNKIDADPLLGNNYGIYLQNTRPFRATEVIVNDNNIQMLGVLLSTTNTVGIKVIETNRSSRSSSQIAFNTITLKSRAIYGMEFNTITGYEVGDNTIDFDLGTFRRIKAGIAINNSKYNNFIHNTINGYGATIATNAANFLPAAIHANLSANNSYECNSMNNTYSGFKVSQDCGNSDFKNNRFENHQVGLLVDNLAKLGTQIDKFNHWHGIYGIGSFAAWNRNTSVLMILGSQFRVNTLLPPYWPPSYSPAISDFFNAFPSAGSISGCIVRRMAEEPKYFNELDSIVANDSIIYTEYDTTLNWQYQKTLYNSLETQGTTSGSIEEDYLRAKATENIGLFSTIDKNYEISQLVDEANELEQAALLNRILEKESDLYTIDSIYGSDTLLVIDSNFILYRDSLLDTLYQLKMALNNLQSIVIDNISTTKLANQDIVSSILDKNEIEAYLKEYYMLYTQKMADEIVAYTSSEKANIEYIANLCPFIGGEAVYKARAIVYSYDDEVMYDDQELCATTSYAYRLANPNVSSSTNTIQAESKKNVQGVNSSFKVYPNPSNEYFIIEYPTSISQYLVIEDIAGKQIYKIALDTTQNKKTIMLDKLASGTYILKVENNQLQTIYQQKISIIK